MTMPSLVVLVSILVVQQCLPASGYYFNHHPTPRTGRHKHHPQTPFSHLEKLLNRLESSAEARPRGQDGAAPVLPEPATSASPLLRSASHPHWKTYKPPHETYEDEDFDTEDDEDNDDEEFDDEEDEDEDEETLDDQYSQSDDHGSRWDIPQSEPRYRPQPSMSPISQSKWETMGSRKGVDKLRNKMNEEYSPNKYEMKKVAEHMIRVNHDGDCKVPRPKLVQVKDEYPHPSKTYMPRCTILHQCGDDSGCCKTETLTCVPRHSNRVELFFYTTTVEPTGAPSPGRVERLVFYNHTECKCEDRNSGVMPRDVETGHYFRRSTSYGSGSIYRKHDWSQAETERPETKSCRCPSKYATRRSRNGGCSCDCFDKQRDCLRMKKGKEYFSLQDRLCIQNEECKYPTCEFGPYLRLAGRCPKKPERFQIWKH